MPRLKQFFRNETGSDQIINLELSTARFRLEPGVELVLFYDSDAVQGDNGATLRVDFISDGGALELSVWTHEDQMFFPDGREAPRDYDPH